MIIRQILFLLLLPLSATLLGQGLDPAALLKQPSNTWPTFNGDYSGRRFSALTQINSSNVHNLGLAWAARFTSTNAATGVQIKSTPLLVNDVLYFTSPNNVWAVDVRTGRELWHYTYPPNTGSTIGNRGVGMYENWLFFETPDSHLVSLDASTGKERWKVQIADPKLDYTSTVAPIIIKNHVVVGIGGDHLDNPGFLESHDPETGKLQWKWWTTPRKGEPGIETWPDEYAAAHGTGQTWMPGTYDPELNLYYIGTGNPNPVMAEKSRKGDNLYTCSIVAVNPDTGKLAWYYQVSPHDVHDWDAAETPVLVDGTVEGKPRKLLLQASRNGYFFVLDRTNGEHILTKPFIDTLNWAKGLNAKGQPIPDPAKYPAVNGVLVSPSSNGATNWPAPSFNPQTGLLYVGSSRTYSMFYLTDTDERPQGWAGLDSVVGGDGGALLALDYRTGKIVWRHDWPSSTGVVSTLSTAGKLLFTSNGNNFIAFDPTDGKILWHASLTASPSNGPITYEIDGKQYVLVAAGDTLFTFTLNQHTNADGQTSSSITSSLGKSR
ncbi:MAG: acido-empty-quinoprotein group A [Acidobacteriaceae bacterium]|nr:acido-empty-quinoprotein group A [Acidobacteriaceae bacterium]MBV9035553.1 acido-empty-quinoprotein group A [Acidobacteriaceae bacterium]MBV9938576.1 acido-empty-quinoprotein group A [Acidobacteriaceae bacterium]